MVYPFSTTRVALAVWMSVLSPIWWWCCEVKGGIASDASGCHDVVVTQPEHLSPCCSEGSENIESSARSSAPLPVESCDCGNHEKSVAVLIAVPVSQFVISEHTPLWNRFAFETHDLVLHTIAVGTRLGEPPPSHSDSSLYALHSLLLT